MKFLIALSFIFTTSSSFAGSPFLINNVSVRDYRSNIFTPEPGPLGAPVVANNSLAKVLRTIKGVKIHIQRAARAFDIDPIHIAGAIAGEHALNVNFLDVTQDYLPRWLTQSDGSELYALIRSAPYQKCNSKRNDYNYWYCVTKIWHRQQNAASFLFSRSAVYRKFTDHFFNPNSAGVSFGLGQMNPLRALVVSDLVSQKTNLPPLNFRVNGDISSTYEVILNEETVVYYVAATIRTAIDIYKETAHFDISNDPGLTATLYNIGNESYKARNRYQKNIRSAQDDETIEVPQSNSLGRWVLQNQTEIRAAIQ